MKQTNFLKSFFLLCALIVGSVSVWGQAAVNTVLWSEDFSGFDNNVDPSGNYTNSHTGTTVYGGVTVTYSKDNGGGTTQTYTTGGPNSNSNLLIAKNNGSFSISGISTGGATELTVSYAKSGSGTIAISSSTTGVTISGSTSGSTITTNGASTLQLTFKNTINSNLRIDDISVKVKTAGTATKVSIPSFSPTAGAVASGTDVTISSATEGSTIYYTTNGVTPTTDDSHGTAGTASATVTVNAAMTIKAIAVKDGLDNSDVASASYTIATPCATPTFSVAAGEVDRGTTVTITTDTDGATIYYTKGANPADPTPSSTPYTSAITISEDMTIKAIAVKDGKLNSEVASVAYTVKDYVTLPFNWAGGGKSGLALDGVETNGLGNDYAAGNAPYLIKLDTTGDYIQIKTNAQPGRVSIGVKMIGGGDTSTITVQESANGTNFDEEGEELSISGSQNDVLELLTTKNFKSTTRYLKFVFTKGSNVGVGPITITGCDAIKVTTAGLATYASDKALDFSGVTGIKAYKASIAGNTITFNIMDKVPAEEGMLIRAMSNLDAEETFYVPQMVTPPSSIENAMKRGEGTAVAYQPNPEIDIYNYVLSGGDNGVGFYKANGETVPTDRAYLQSTTASAKGFVINYDDEEGEETDGIKAVSTKVENGVRYNLAGQKVGADYKGIVIVNGKKVIIK